MAAALRQGILSALKTKIETIDGTGDNRVTFATVEYGARSWADVKTGERDYCGIAPREERFDDMSSGYVHGVWTIDLVLHLTPAANTLASVAAKLSDVLSDVRRVLYNDATLGQDGVILTRLVSRLGSEGSPESAIEGVASCVLTIEVEYQEDRTDV